MSAIDLGDLTKYQKDPKYLPDKSDKWNIALNDDPWILSHRSLRGELDEIKNGLQAIVAFAAAGDDDDDDGIPDWKVQLLQSMWSYHKKHVLAHHEAEDRVVKPFLETRFRYPEQAQVGHEGLATLVGDLDNLVLELSEKPRSVEKVKSLQEALSKYADTLNAHMQEEDDWGLPLLRAYFTQAEYSATSQKMGMEGGESGSFVYYCGEEFIRKNFMAKQKIPFIVWRVAFLPAMKKYKQEVIVPRMALEENKVPENVDSNCVVM